MRVAVDSNVLLYAEGLNDPERQRVARTVMAALASHEIVLPIQVSGELFNVLSRKFGRGVRAAREAVLLWETYASLRPSTTPDILSSALDLGVDHRFQVWDAIILAAAAKAGCRMLLSEDMHHGFVFRGVTVVDPFAAVPHPLLADLLRT